VVAKRLQDQGSADVLHGAALVARRDEPSQSEASDLGNVIPFARPRRTAAAAPFPLPSIAADERPAPYDARIWIGVGIACFAASLALHSVLLAMFWHKPRPMASVGIEVISVDIVLGATTEAGLAPTPGEQEALPSQRADEQTDDPAMTERSRAATVMPQEIPAARVETAPEVKPQETPAEAESADPKPQEQQPETAVAETPSVTQPAERTAQPRPQVRAVQKAPERKRIDAPTEKKAAKKKQVAAATNSDGARGIGRGRSDRNINYDGIVRAHLVRHKQSLNGVPGTGVATVQFLLDGRGRVTSARLARSSGVAAFDREALAMVRRASPFPPHPEGRASDYTIPVRFTER
jgi:periplasmic protein TonB